MSLLQLTEITVHRGPCPVIDRVSLRVDDGEFVGLIGPNGAGKTTLLRAALGLLPHRGESNLSGLDPLSRARQAAWLPQAREIAWPMAVEHLVMLGRMPRGNRRASAADHAAVASALLEMGLDGFGQRIATELSGGEQARVLLARALAQETPLILADEPIAGLDPAHQITTMDLFARLAGQGRGIVVSIHDLGLAARHCTRLVLLHQGRVVADGSPAHVLTPEILAEVFRITAHYQSTPSGPVFQPLEVLP